MKTCKQKASLILVVIRLAFNIVAFLSKGIVIGKTSTIGILGLPSWKVNCVRGSCRIL